MLGDALGPYRLRTQLGSGGMGEVWLAERDGQPVALKVLHWHLLSHPPFVERFLREGEIGVRISDPHVARTLDVGTLERDGRAVHYIAMEYVEGRTLRALLDELGRIPEALCRHIGAAVARGLGAIHAAGAIHRDVKPENVLVTRDHDVKLTDLGVARDADDVRRLSSVGTFVGTVAYAAPEQFRTRDLDGRADLYALGVTLYESACGAHPLAEGEAADIVQRHLSVEARRLGARAPHVSAFFEELIHTLLVKERAERFPSARELIAVLETGESSVWWRNRARAIRNASGRPPRRPQAPHETLFVGRGEELGALREAWIEALRGDGRVLLVEGPDGSGRTRLVQEWVREVREGGADADVLYGESGPSDAVSGSGPFTSAFRERFGTDKDELEDSFHSLPELGAALAAVLREDAAPPAVSRDALRAAFVHAVQTLAAERPLLMVVEDLHRASADSLDVFTSIALGVQGRPILLVGTGTPDESAPWRTRISAAPCARVALSPLSRADLLRAISGTPAGASPVWAELAEERRNVAVTAAAGSPGRALAILRACCACAGGGDDELAPGDIEIADDPWAATVRSLGGTDRAALEVAACAGAEFDAGFVARALGRPAFPLLERLRRLERCCRIVRTIGSRFAFADLAMRDAVLRGMPESRAREWHGALAATLERDSGAADAEPGSVPPATFVRLAGHAVAAGDRVRAGRYLGPALASLEARYAHDRASRLCARALLATPPDDDPSRVALLLSLAASHSAIGRVEDEREALREAAERARSCRDGVRARVELARAESALRCGAYSEAVDLAEAAAASSAGASDDGLRRRADCVRAGAYRAAGRTEEAESLAETVLASAVAAADAAVEADARAVLGALATARGEREFALAQAVRRGELARQSGNRADEASALVEQADLAIRQGRAVEAGALLARAEELATSAGARDVAGRAASRAGDVHWHSGDLAGALAAYERFLVTTLESGDRREEAHARARISTVLTVAGDGTAAAQHAAAAAAIADELDDEALRLDALLLHAAVAQESGDSTAVDLAARAVALARELRASAPLARALIVLAATPSCAGDPAEIRRLLGEAHGAARTDPEGMLVPLVTAALAAVDPYRVPEAEATRARSGGAMPLVDRMRMRYDLWRASGDARHLAEAKRLLDHLVARSPERLRGSIASDVALHRSIQADAEREGVA